MVEIHLSIIDWAILVTYVGFVVWIGFYLKRYMKSDEDYFLAGRSNTAWVAGIAFMSANMGALEIIGYAGLTIKYGLSTAHFYLIGAIPAMLFLGIYMMPFYYKNKIKSVPGYIRERYDKKTQLLNAFAFALLMILVAGIALYALALVLHTFLAWNWTLCIWISAGLVGLYISLSGLLSAIFTEVIQFFLIWAGILLIPISGIIEFGSSAQIVNQLSAAYTSLWSNMGSAASNPMHVSWYGLVLGLGFVASFSYWTTDFLVIQRAFSAKDLRSAKLSPIIASFFKILLGIVVVGSGILALSLLQDPASGFTLLKQGGHVNYDSAIPLLMMRYFPPGMLGLGVTTLVAMFMAGQAGNLSAFTTVWTYDIYQPAINPEASEDKLIWVGRVATVVGIILSIGAAYWARSAPTIIDFLLALNSVILVPMFTVILLGMFFKSINPTAAFWGGLTGMITSFITFILLQIGWIGVSAITPSEAASVMAANFWRSIWAFLITGGIAVIGSFFTTSRPEAELEGLVKGVGDVEADAGSVGVAYSFYEKPEFWAVVSLIIFILLNIYFW